MVFFILYCTVLHLLLRINAIFNQNKHLVLGIFSVSISKKKGLFCFLLPAVRCNVFRKKINCEERKKTLLYSVYFWVLLVGFA